MRLMIKKIILFTKGIETLWYFSEQLGKELEILGYDVFYFDQCKEYRSVIKQMKGELSSKNQQLQNLVDQLLSKQAKKYTTLKDLFTDIKDGKVDVDPATIAQAQKDVADDGYWGVDKTSDRLVDMAKALSGGDSSKADTLIAAIKKGFDQAADAWGGEKIF